MWKPENTIFVIGWLLWKGITGSPVIVWMTNTSQVILPCGSEAILICNTMSGALSASWYVDSTTTLAAQCLLALPCQVFNNFSGRASYSFDHNAGIANLTINKCALEDDKKEIDCNDVPSHLLGMNVKVLPQRLQTIVTNVTNGTDVKLQATTNCIYPPENVTMIWYYTLINGSRIMDTSGTKPKTVSCDSILGDCIDANKSQKLSTSLEFKTTENEAGGQWRNYSVELIYEPIDKNDSGIFEIPAGTFNCAYTDNSKTTSENPPNNSTINYTTNITHNETTKGDNLAIELGAGIGGSVVVVCGVIALCFWCYNRKNKDKYKSDFEKKENTAMTNINEDGKTRKK